MTIASGFRLENSLLVCTDSLYTDGFTKHYGTKIFSGALGKKANALFAVAGGCDYTQAFIQHLSNVTRDRDMSLSLIKETLFQETSEFYKTHENALESVGMQIIIAIHHEADGLCLSVCANSSWFESANNFEFIGCGASVAKPLADWMYSAVKTDKDRGLLAFTVLAAIKHIDPNCGGNTQFGVLHKNKSESFIDQDGIVEDEGFASCFFEAATCAFFGCAKYRSGGEAKESIDRFSGIAKMLHEFPIIKENRIFKDL